MDTTVLRARRAFLWVGIIVPGALLALSILVVIAWMPQLPDPIAIHWSGSQADGFGPRWMVTVTALIGAAMVAFFALFAYFAHRMPQEFLAGGGGVVTDADGTPQWSATARGLGALSLGLSAMMAIVTVASAEVQRGLSDAADAPSIGFVTFIGFLVLIAVTVLGWFLQPRVPTSLPRTVDFTGAPVLADRDTTWTGSVAIARSGIITLGVSLSVLVVITVLDFALDLGAAWFMLATTVGVTLLVATCLFFRVRVSAAGLQVRSMMGWPNTRIPLAEIEKIAVTQVDPFAEFGGWGWRYGMDGRRGVVMRKGEALHVTRSNGKVFVVTVDGARQAAAVLEGLRGASDPDGSDDSEGDKR